MGTNHGDVVAFVALLLTVFKDFGKFSSCRDRRGYDMPGALHHIMVRGINRSPIFIDEEDKQRFLDRLGHEVTEGKCSVYAWVLMDNHYLC